MESSYTESYTLRVKKEELIKINEELKKAKESATQSWLDSRPLIDELERLKSNHENAQNRLNKSKTLVSELEAELEATNLKINLKKEEELESTKMVLEITRALDQLGEEMESLKRFAGEKRQKKLKLKRVLRLRRQKLRSLQLRMEAVRKETEACCESRDQTFRYLNASETLAENKGVDGHGHGHEQVQVLSHEEYMALKKRADDENSLADWRVSVATEQKIEAEKSRDLAKEKLRGLKVGKRVMRGRNKVREREEDINNIVGEEEEEEEGGRRADNREIIEIVIPMADQPRKGDYDRGQEVRRTENNTKRKKDKKMKKKKMVKGKKRSIFWQMKQCFVFDIIRRLFRR